MEDQKWLTTSAGVKMPRIIYGTAWKKDRTADLVVKAIQAGFRGIDTAGQPKHYDEALVGEALQRLKNEGVEREALFLQTKFTPLSGQDPGQVPYDINSPIELQVVQSFEDIEKKPANRVCGFSNPPFTRGPPRAFDDGVGGNGKNSKGRWGPPAGNQQLLRCNSVEVTLCRCRREASGCTKSFLSGNGV